MSKFFAGIEFDVSLYPTGRGFAVQVEDKINHNKSVRTCYSVEDAIVAFKALIDRFGTLRCAYR